MKRKKRVSSITLPDGRVIDVIELKGRNGKKSLKMQPRRDSLKEGEKTVLGHTKEGKGLDHFNGYQKTQGKIVQCDVSIEPNKCRSLPLSRSPVTLQSGETILGIYGETLPPSIYVNKSGGTTAVYASGVSGGTVYAGSVEFL